MKTAIIIPARLGSTRLPEKPLIEVKGKPIILWLLENIKDSKVDDIIVATDSKEIKGKVIENGFNSVLTSKTIKSGSDRVFQVAKEFNVDFIINVQGDEPLIKSNYINDFLNFINNFDIKIIKSSVFTIAKFKTSFEEYINPNNVKVVIDNKNRALYFSRARIPFYRENDFKGFYHHYGIYGYSLSLLEKFIKMESILEKYEKLEQLRFLENGYNIYVQKVNFDLIGIDTKEDVIKFEKYVSNQHYI